jgi:hypothetical protein
MKRPADFDVVRRALRKLNLPVLKADHTVLADE